MRKFAIEGEEYVVLFDPGYTPEKRVSFKRDWPGVYANNGNKRRWFRARLLKNMTKQARQMYA